MRYWESEVVLTGLMVGLVLALAAVLRRVLSIKLVPDSMVAGMLGLFLGSSFLGWLDFNTEILESIVYHGLALIFITVALQTPTAEKKTPGALSFSIGIPFIALIQGAVGMVAILIIAATAKEPLHPGFGLMLPLGFNQGPGQALSLGNAWEASGMERGGQVGLIVAAIGFIWAVVAGALFVYLGRLFGWASLDDPAKTAALQSSKVGRGTEETTTQSGGALEPLLVQFTCVALIYFFAYQIVEVLVESVGARENFAAMVWGFHFLVAAGLAFLFRKILSMAPVRSPLDNRLLAQTTGTIVDVSTASALAAIQIAVLTANWAPILALTTIGGAVTFVLVLWLAKRAFPERPFEHGLVLFGTATGTMTTGLALLRVLDPKLEGPVATNTVLGVTGAIVFGLPLLVVILPLPIAGWPDNTDSALFAALGISAAYMLLLVIIWRFRGHLRFLRPLANLWPKS